MLPTAKRVQNHEYIHQGLLESVLKKIFPLENISSNSRKLASIKNPETGKHLELDIVIPTKQLCFEFQDIHHYITTWYFQRPLPSIRNRDIMKHVMVRGNEETLVVVPCWWDGCDDSLVATLQFHRPDLQTESDKSSYIPIPLNPPSSFVFGATVIPEVGELMVPSFPMDANFVDSVSIENAWWIGEKYDGIRVCWNPTRKHLYSRKGMKLDFHESLSVLIPRAFIDGEIWFGRGLFTNANPLVASSEFVEWHMLRMTAFDIVPVTLEDLEKPFEERYADLLDVVPEDHSFLTIAFRMFSSNKRRLVKILKMIIRKGGEGLILRKPNSVYERGKSSALFKLKVARGDKEAIVVDIRSSSVILKLPNDTKFVIYEPPLPNLQRGDIVTFSYDHFSSHGIPVKPKLIKIRSDVNWRDLVANEPPTKDLPSRTATEVRTAGYWVKGKGKNMRKFFENFARDRGMDPLVSHTWYSTPQTLISDTEAGRVILKYFDNDYVRTLNYVFPELVLDENKVLDLHQNRYKDASKRRKWFERVALRRGLDPLVAATWYKLAKKRFHNIPGAKEVLQYYSNSSLQAIVHLFPEIGLELDKFPTITTRHFWRKLSNRRYFFSNYAKQNGFDPLVPENWYNANFQHIIAQGASGFISQYNGSVSSALVDCYPEIGLDESKFLSTRRHHWKVESNRRAFFEKLALQHHIDPLLPDSWYFFPTHEIVEKGAKGFLSYYNGSVSKALVELFPDIGLDLSKFSNAPKNYWTYKENRRKYFIQFASENNFDPLVAANWYSAKAQTLVEKRSSGCLAFYEGNIPKALMDAFPEIGLEKSRLNDLPKHFWKDCNNQRKVFEQFALENGFDALVPENWYDRSKRPQLKKKTWNFISFYNGSISRALIELFPELHLKKSKF